MNVIKLLHRGIRKLLHQAGPGSETILNYKACDAVVIRSFRQTINAGKDSMHTSVIRVPNARLDDLVIDNICRGSAKSGVALRSVGESRYVSGSAWRPEFLHFSRTNNNKLKDVDPIPVCPASRDYVEKTCISITRCQPQP